MCLSSVVNMQTICSVSADLCKFTCRNNKVLCIASVWKRGKKKKMNAKTGCDLALEHFDTFYRPMYGDLWPSIRISLLTKKKPAAVVNNFTTHPEDMLTKLTETYDIVEEAASLLDLDKKVLQKTEKDVHNESSIPEPRQKTGKLTGNAEKLGLSSELYNINEDTDAKIATTASESESESLGNVTNEAYRTDLHMFVPAKNVYSERDQLLMEETVQSTYTPGDVRVNFTTKSVWTLPENLKVMVYPKGDVTVFPDPKGSLLSHFMMDAASVLPVIALDLQQDDHVLDLCSAPGGKALAMLQTELPEKVTCVENSSSRLSRLYKMLRYYLPPDILQNVRTLNKDGRDLDTSKGVFDKVLVDVPCNTDRHYLSEPVNNLFNSHRMSERLRLPELQKELLLAGIKLCAPGGSVVYSTCTLSFAQNDGVVQQAVDEIWKSTNIDVAIEDLKPLQNLFKKTFNFFDGCRYGQLVIPSLSSNFGPMYFCKINRLN